MPRYVVVDGVSSVELDGETVLLDSNSGQYFRLNATGTAVWHAIQAGTSISATVASLSAEHGIDESTVRRDVESLLTNLEEQRLLATQ
jgi:Coenzyme PQQ synthesis protein D (PqqD)